MESINTDHEYRPRSYWTAAQAGQEPQRSDGINRPNVAPGFGDRAYLPGADEDEVEIALVSLESPTGDLISIRASRLGDGIKYRVVDEYGSDFYVPRPVRASELTLGELIELIDTVEDRDNDIVGLTDRYLDMNFELGGDAAALIGFVRITSRFYPQLEGHYQQHARAWAAARKNSTE